MQICHRIINTWGRILTPVLLMLFFCRCTDNSVIGPEAELNEVESKITFNIRHPLSGGDIGENRINSLQLFFFEGDTYVPLLTQTLVNPNGSIISTITPLADEYFGRTLTVVAIANKKIPLPGTLGELKQTISRIQQDQLKKNGLPMSSEEVTFTARKGTQQKELRLKRVHSAIYAKIADGCVGVLSDFTISVSGSQQKGGYLFADKMIEEEVAGEPFSGLLEGKTSGPDPVGYFYPTQGDIIITITPDAIRYPGANPKLVTIEASKAMYRNRKYMLNITPSGNTVDFDVKLLAWSESGIIVDFSQYDKNELENLNVNIGTKVIRMNRHGENYSLALNGTPSTNILFSLPPGAQIAPDPNTVLRIPGKYTSQQFRITSASGITGKPFTIQYYPDPVYTLVVLGDTEWNMRGYPIQQAIADANKIAQIKREGRHSYKGHPAFKYNPELLMVVGDISPDRDNSPKDFLRVFDGCYKAGIKCMNLFGNHDWDPEYWGGDKNDPGFSYWGGELQMNNSRKRIAEAAKRSNISLEYIISKEQPWSDPMPYAFTYRKVKYYCGNSFWFLPYYRSFNNPSDPPMWIARKPQFKNADPIIERLERKVNENAASPAIWMQHYPFISNWWEDFSHDGNYNTMEKRKAKIKELIFKTKNPAFFAGHIHHPSIGKYSNGQGKTFTEYVTPLFQDGGGSGYFALVSEKEGVLTVDRFSADALLR